MMIFSETQRFKQVWIWIALTISTAFLCYNAYVEYSNNKELSIQVVFGFSVMLILFVLFFIIRLKTIIDEEKIQYKFYPFHLSYRTILSAEIETIEIVKYRPIDYGGWGIKQGLGTKVYSTSGNKGIKITTKNKKILIGTLLSESSKLIELIEFLNQKSKIKA
jgi:hypothetical protein